MSIDESADQSNRGIVYGTGLSVRLTRASWQMLQRLAQPQAALVFCQDDGRFHFTLRGERLDMVRKSTIEALKNAHLLKSERRELAVYVINESGNRALRNRVQPSEILEAELGVSQNITLVSQPLDS